MRLLATCILRLRPILIASVFLLVIGIVALGQSTDARSPTLVSAHEIVDSIAARDIGDSRLTDYFYTFTGLPGDLLITLESKNLNGDIDVFTAGELRPLLKMTFYAESSTSASKNIYLRKRESLILRIEARTPNDDPGTYRIRFTGSFEPISGAGLTAESERAGGNTDSSRVSDRKTTRVSSVGARIEEPVEEVAAAPTPKPTPTPEMTAEPKPEKKVKTQPANENNVRTILGRRRPPKKNPPQPSAPSETAGGPDPDSKDSSNKKTPEDASRKAADAENGAAPTTAAKNAVADADNPPAESKPTPSRRPVVRKPPPRTAERKTAAKPENRARLVIEQKDGSRREFLMSNVRKVTVENGEIVVEANDGFIQRISMTQVARMSIGP